MAALPKLFMLLYPDEPPVRAVFHGTMTEKEFELLSNRLNHAGERIVRPVIFEKYRDGNDGYHYTILTLGCDKREVLDARLEELYPNALRVPDSGEHSIRDIVRAVVIK